jgi:hypothetical protein
MTDNFIQLDGEDDPISVVLSISPPARGDYRFKLWNERGREPELRGASQFGSEKEYRHSLGSALELRGRTLTWSSALRSRRRQGRLPRLRSDHKEGQRLAPRR